MKNSCYNKALANTLGTVIAQAKARNKTVGIGWAKVYAIYIVDTLGRHYVATDRLEALLVEASNAHHEYETFLGHYDLDWPRWYGQYVADRLVHPDRREAPTA